MERDFEKLIGGIMILLFGGVATIFWKKISAAMLASHKTFWGKLGIGKDRDSTWDKWFAKIFVLVLGIAFLAGGICLLYQFFSGKDWYW